MQSRKQMIWTRKQQPVEAGEVRKQSRQMRDKTTSRAFPKEKTKKAFPRSLEHKRGHRTEAAGENENQMKIQEHWSSEHMTSRFYK